MRLALGLAALLLAAGLVVSWPLALEWRDGLPLTARAPLDRAVLTGAPGDALQLYYQLWLVRDGLLGPTPLFTDPYQFRVDGPRWNLPQTFLPLALPFTALSVFGLHAAYNLLVLLSFPAAGLTAWALARHCWGPGPGALVAGIGFALVPARLGPLFGGHPAGFAAALVPAVLWGLDRALTCGALGGGAAGGLALLALAMLEPQYTYLVAGFALVYALVRAAAVGRVAGRPAAVAAFALGTAAGAAWLWLLRQAFVAGSVAAAGRGLDEVRLFSPGLAALGDPATYGGAALGALAVVGLAAPGPRRSGELRVLFGGALVAGLALSLGPTIPHVPVYQALHRWLPLFAMIRNPEKLRILASLGAAVLAARGAAVVADGVGGAARRRGQAGAAILVAAVLLMTPPWHGIAVARFPDSPVYAALRRDATRVLYLPVWPGDSAYASVYLYAITRTRVPTVNGYSPLVPRAYRARVFQPLEPLNVGDLGPAEAAALRALGVSHVVVDRAVFPPQVSGYPSGVTLDGLRRSATLHLVAAADPLWLFAVTGEAPRAAAARPTSPVGVFLEAEWQARQTGAVADEPAASGGRVVAGRPGRDRPGFLAFGPYRSLPAGAYVARFRVRGRGLRADVAADQGRRILAVQPVDAGPAWMDVTLPFRVERADPLELRVSWDGEDAAAVDWVLAVAADRPDPEWRYEVEALPHRLGERPDPAASGGWAGFADPAESLRGPLTGGPARLFPAGRYRLVLRLRADPGPPGPLARLQVTEPAGRELAGRTIDAAEVPPGAYREVGLEFALVRPTVLEFPVTYLGRVTVAFDRLDVVPR